MPAVLDASLSLRWLGLSRRSFLVLQGGFVLLAGAEAELPVGPWLVGIAALLALDGVVRLANAGRQPGPHAVRAHVAVDLLLCTAILLASGGAQNPVAAFYLVELALVAVVLPRREAWGATAAALLLQAVAVLWAHPLHGLDDAPHEHPVHLIGHIVAFDVAALAITALVGRLSATLRERELALREADVRHADSERLAALGELAVGTAHALGTPLGSIELLAEEMALDLPERADGRTAWTGLRTQLARVREILDRLLAGDGGSGGATPAIAQEVGAWVAEWASSRQLPVSVELGEGLDGAAVRGEGARWRDALWTLLDNGRRAGPPLSVRVWRDDAAVHVVVTDAGPPVTSDALSRAGTPFHSGWSGEPGAGLGLYVARRFARAAGGDLTLRAGSSGAIATLVLAVEGR